MSYTVTLASGESITIGSVTSSDTFDVGSVTSSETYEVLPGSGAAGPAGAKGDKGDIGDAGLKGDKGDIGSTGLAGSKGDKGDTGSIGLTGLKGDKGDTGAKGEPGIAGTNGIAGVKGDQGNAFRIIGTYSDGRYTNGPFGTVVGQAGDAVLYTNAPGDLAVWNVNTNLWEIRGNVLGPQGVKGDKGDPGATGTTGTKGDKGDPGPAGTNGTAGVKGDKGDPGVSADQTLNTNSNVTFANVVVNGNMSLTGNITGNTANVAIGYRDIPQNFTNTSYTLALSDAGKHILTQNTGSGTQILTIANNSTVAHPVGTAIAVVVQSTGTVSVANGAGVTMYLAGNSTAKSTITLNSYSQSTLLKIGTNVWFVTSTSAA